MSPAEKLAAMKSKTKWAKGGGANRRNQRRVVECRLKEKMVDLGLTPTDLAGALDVSHVTVKRMAEGGDPSLGNVVKVCLFFGCPPAEVWPEVASLPASQPARRAGRGI